MLLAPHAGFAVEDQFTVSSQITGSSTPPPPPPPSEGGGSSPSLHINAVKVKADSDSAVLVWKTSWAVRSTVQWGRTGDYELGALHDPELVSDHSAKLTALLPGVRYYFRIGAESLDGITEFYEGSFATLSLPDTEGPTLVMDFTAVPRERAIQLSWRNPADPDFDRVRIVRSYLFFPADPWNGEVIYEGPGTSVLDTDVETDVTYYYTAFAIDESGNYSGGTVASARLGAVIPRDPFLEVPQAPEVHPDIQALTLADFDFIQHGEKISFSGNQILIDGAAPLTIQIDYDKLPEVLKTIGVTLTDPLDPEATFSFILRVTPGKDYYTATLGALGRSGTYDMAVHILDYRNQGLKKLFGDLLVAQVHTLSDEELTSLGFVVRYIGGQLLNLFFVLLILLLVYLVHKARRRAVPVPLRSHDL